MIDSHEFADLDNLAKGLPKEINGYIYEKKIGQGGFSRSFLCHSKKLDMDFCAKVMVLNFRPGANFDSDSDLKILARLDHPNIVRVYDRFRDGKMYHLILEFCSNGSLGQMIKRNMFNSPEMLMYYMKEILSGLSYCHSKHIAHRDIKPGNILIDSYGRPKIIDFGISEIVEPGEQIEVFSGSRPYSAPEVLQEEKHDPYKADVWSLGVTFYCMAVGGLPWPREEKVMRAMIQQAQYTIPKHVDNRIAELIQEMLDLNPKARPDLADLLKRPMFQRDFSNLKLPFEQGPDQLPSLVPSTVRNYYVVGSNLARSGAVKTPKVRSTVSSMEEFAMEKNS